MDVECWLLLRVERAIFSAQAYSGGAIPLRNGAIEYAEANGATRYRIFTENNLLATLLVEGQLDDAEKLALDAVAQIEKLDGPSIGAPRIVPATNLDLVPSSNAVEHQWCAEMGESANRSGGSRPRQGRSRNVERETSSR